MRKMQVFEGEKVKVLKKKKKEGGMRSHGSGQNESV